ncbi:hypothetical protein DASC09_001120 [Saccharomycopsis crataegensis]|uniref:Uncharacterized protein n=1 Tax=Saccharomycopsis crataegensis TaxID=43959 RepID=A0AAV5QDF9_9ASCO|nr:hypothetical protein DASC09_001120 [Saccharomycopsis crataegensis]
MLSSLGSRLSTLKLQSIKPRHYVVIILVFFLVFYALLISSSTTTTSRPFHLLEITFSSGDASSGVYYADALTELQVDIGYFSSCIQTNYLNNIDSWTCGTNEKHLLLTDSNFSDSSDANVDLLNLYIGTAQEFRKYCLTPYVVVAALAVAFFTLVMFAFSSPQSSPGMYKYAAMVCFLGFAITLVAAVWQETNILTATHLMKTMVDSYYEISISYNIIARVFVWMGVGLMLIATGLLAFLAVIGTLIRDIAEEVFDEEKM